jgi:hypothetical protein
MKIRKCFVSNSSTSCFICGIYSDCKYSIEEIVEILKKMLNFYNDMEESSLSFDDVFETPRIAEKEDKKTLGYYNVSEDRVDNKILILGADDNSVPWCLFEMIEHKFNAERIHLG